MSRLAVRIEPPGGFWEKSQKCDQTVQKQMAKVAVSIKPGTTQYTYI